MTIVETTCSVTAVVDTHADVHVATVVDQVGGVLGIETFDTTATGCRQLLEWLRVHGEINLVGVEGTGSYGLASRRAPIGARDRSGTYPRVPVADCGETSSSGSSVTRVR